MKTIDPELLRSVVESVVARLSEGTSKPAPAPAAKASCGCGSSSSGGERGVFNCVEKAAEAANDAHLKLKKLGVAGRAKVIEIVKKDCPRDIVLSVECGTIEQAERSIKHLKELA